MKLQKVIFINNHKASDQSKTHGKAKDFEEIDTSLTKGMFKSNSTNPKIPSILITLAISLSNPNEVIKTSS